MIRTVKYGALVVAFAIVTSSCSIFKSTTVSGSDATQTDTVDATTGATSVTNTTNKTEAKKQTETKTQTQHKISNVKVTSYIEGEWYINTVGKNKIEQDEDVPYIVFENETSRFYASNGCNVLNGNFSVTSDNAITFSNVLTTMQLCPDVKYESDINAVLADGVTVNASLLQVGGESYISLTDAKSHELMRLRRHNLGFLNGNWQVVSISGSKVDDEDATIFFDLSELKIHGNTGCNYFNGEIYIYPTKANAIDFSKMGVTRMSCPKTKQETAMLVALEQTQTVVKSDKEHAILLDASGKEVMKLKRLVVEAE